MTELYCEPDAFGGEYSRWGYEMTMKLKEDNPELITDMERNFSYL